MLSCYVGSFLMWLGRTFERPGKRLIQVGAKIHVSANSHHLKKCVRAPDKWLTDKEA